MKKIKENKVTVNTADNRMGGKKEKKKFYKKKRFWLIVLLVLLIGNAGSSGEKTEVKETTKTVTQVKEKQKAKESKSDTKEKDKNDTEEKKKDAELPTDDMMICRVLTQIFVQDVLGENYSLFDFNVEGFKLDENGNGTIDILYMPSNTKNGITKVNLTISKNGKVYKTEYALLNGVYEVDLNTVPNKCIEFYR